MRVKSPAASSPLQHQLHSSSSSRRLLKKPSESPGVGSSAGSYWQVRQAENGPPVNVEGLDMQYFIDRYGILSPDEDSLRDEMRMVLGRKRSEVHSLTVYRDELRLMSGGEPIKVSMQTLK